MDLKQRFFQGDGGDVGDMGDGNPGDWALGGLSIGIDELIAE
jgi:hypothetical protein